MLIRRKRYYLLRGVCMTCAILLCAAIVLIVRLGLSFHGICMGAIPEVAAPVPCSFWEYISRNVPLFCLVAAVTYWPWLLAIALLPSLVGYWIDRRNRHAT